MALHPVQGIERGVGGEDSSNLFCYMLNTRGAYHLSAGFNSLSATVMCQFCQTVQAAQDQTFHH